jgi:hypothetical protein
MYRGLQVPSARHPIVEASSTHNREASSAAHLTTIPLIHNVRCAKGKFRYHKLRPNLFKHRMQNCNDHVSSQDVVRGSV